MARISKPGLDYFPLDVNFLQDRKVRRISCRHHAAGIAALTSLLCLIYKEKGYYISWNKDTLFDIAQEACCEEEEMQAIIDDCLAVGLFDDLIYKEYGVLTSQAIQEQYHKIITDSRSNLHTDTLLPDAHTCSLLRFFDTEDKSFSHLDNA